MSKPFGQTRLVTAMAGIALAAVAGQSSGAAFALAEQNVMGLGNAFAGAGATAEDANTIWFNPAGLGRLSVRGRCARSARRVVAGGTAAASARPWR